MDAMEAFKALLDGKKIKRKNWTGKGWYCCLHMETGGLRIQHYENFLNIPNDRFFEDEWELYKPKHEHEYFDFFEAMKRMKDGKKVTNVNSDECYAYSVESGAIYLIESKQEADFIAEEINCQEWYEVE